MHYVIINHYVILTYRIDSAYQAFISPVHNASD